MKYAVVINLIESYLVFSISGPPPHCLALLGPAGPPIQRPGGLFLCSAGQEPLGLQKTLPWACLSPKTGTAVLESSRVQALRPQSKGRAAGFLAMAAGSPAVSRMSSGALWQKGSGRAELLAAAASGHEGWVVSACILQSCQNGLEAVGGGCMHAFVQKECCWNRESLPPPNNLFTAEEQTGSRQLEQQPTQRVCRVWRGQSGIWRLSC